MSELDLDAIEARAKAATPGPWKVTGATIVWSPIAKAVIAEASELRPTACKYVEFTKVELGSPDFDEVCANAAFIYHAREDVPALIAELRKLREENARLEELLNRAARIASELTGFPWPLPKPPEVKEDDEESRCLDQADMPGGFP